MGELKLDLNLLTGNDEAYYQTLDEFGFEKANEINDRETQVKVYKEAVQKLAKLQKKEK
jgi:hypothetical protein